MGIENVDVPFEIRNVKKESKKSKSRSRSRSRSVKKKKKMLIYKS